jgi:2-succinyl-6-hydroxy-2,4-cyclohexadiene-1-carboxylate synthase
MLKKQAPLVFIHGFLGTPEDWNPMLSFFEEIDAHCLDLNALFPREHSLGENSFASLVDNILKYLKKNKISKFHLVGYSLGGRIAMALSQKVSPLSLTILSSHFGIASQNEKKKRWEKDLLIASLLKELSRKSFLEKWYSNPLFPPQLKNTLVESRLANPADISLLEKMLLNLNVTKQPFFLPHLPKKTLFIYGEKDTKYKKLYESSIPKNQLVEVPNAYHMLPIEAPKETSAIIEKFIH